MRPTLLIGANGQLGSDLRRELSLSNRPVVALTHADLEICDHSKVRHVLKFYDPDVVINTAAFHKVEACEEDPGRAFAVNTVAVRNLTLACNIVEARLVQLSTDYVFDGAAASPYREDAAVNPVNVYGASKAAGEFFVRNFGRRHLLIRTSGLYGVAGSSGKGGNFVQTMLRLGRERGVVSVVTDQTLSPTYTHDLAGMIRHLVDSNAQGLFHVTNSGSASWYEFSQAIFDFSAMDVEVRPVLTETQSSPVRRPKYSVLANVSLLESGFQPMRPWREALQSYLGAIRDPSIGGSTVEPLGATNAAN